MTRLLVHVEGKTEQEFVEQILSPHLLAHGYSRVDARGMGSSRQRERRQGVKPWASVKDAIEKHLKEDPSVFATIMVDYYGMPKSTWPGRTAANDLKHEKKAPHVEDQLLQDIQKENPQLAMRFVPFVLMHEFEALLFSDCARFASGLYKPELEDKFLSIRGLFASPEHINDSPQTAPSKRVLELMPNYQRPLFGNLAALEVGLSTMRLECAGFNQWLTRLEDIGKSAT